MNFYICLLFLGFLSGFNLIILSLLYVLDIAKAASSQKIIVIKTGLSMIVLAPLIFSILRIFSSKTIEIMMPLNLANHPLARLADNIHMVQGINWPYYLFTIYMVCTLLMLFQIVLSYFSAKRLLASSLPTVIHEQPVFLNENISSPLSFGFPTAKIYLPTNAEKIWAYREIEMSLAHENMHIKRNDPLWKLASLIIRAILFFAPWSYSLHKKFELEMEIICDEGARISTNAGTKEYSDLLLAMSCIKSHHPAFTNMSDSTLKRRLIVMKTERKQRSILTSALSAMLLLTGTVAIAMSSSINPGKSDFNILSRIYVDGDLVSAPRIIAHVNQKASIIIADNITTKDNHMSMSGHNLKLELIARDMAGSGKNDGIRINYNIQYLNGKEKMHSKPQFILTPNQEGIITISEAGHTYEIHVLANRI